MKKTYADLNLKEIMNKAGLEFAHFTYPRSKCSCCYGAKDLASRYWKDGIIPAHDDYSFILFKNAENGSGSVTKKDEIENYTCVLWGNLTEEQMEIVCSMLQEQLGDFYHVVKPETSATTIIIYTVDKL